MTETIFALPAPAIPILGDTRAFPVGRIFCVGRNYAAHAREMGSDPNREPPFFFMKPAAAATLSQTVPYPADTKDLHHEAELVLAIGKDKSILGYAVGVDLTKRDRQNEAKAASQPWERSKAFPFSAPISPIRTGIAAPADARITLSVNGAAKQDSRTSHMIWNIPEICARVDQLWGLHPGDLIFTGTPEGVGPLQVGDQVRVEIETVGVLAFSLGH
ncbi:MAG: fumarylacetoacetate hydrolase family protein [Caulobacterales bacterium]